MPFLELLPAGRVRTGVVVDDKAGLLDMLAQSDEGRLFTALGAGSRLAPGLALPAPTGAFPRYVDPNEPAEAAKPKAKGKERG